MSIFSKIKDAIFGKKVTPLAPAAPVVVAAAAPATTAPAAVAAPVAPPAPVAMADVDVEAILDGLAASATQKLNWHTSIVDMMKLLGMESSLAERRELAAELGYTGDTHDTATMNIWLHKQVLKQLAANGGKVPAKFLD